MVICSKKLNATGLFSPTICLPLRSNNTHRVMAEKRSNYSKKTSNRPLTPEELGGRIPPQALELEEAVLGAIMVEQDAIVVVSEMLTADAFYREANRSIYRAILELMQRQEPIDLYTVTEELRRRGELDEVGGAAHLAALTQRVGSAAHIEYHAKIVVQKHVQRELIHAASNIQQRAFDEQEDVEELINYSEQEIFKIAEGSLKSDARPISNIITEALRNIDEASQREEGLSGVPSRFTALDRLTSGWQKSDLIIVAARPSMGKTAFVLSMARNMAVEHNVPVVMFSLEMSSVQLVNRLLVSESELGSEKIRSGKLTPDERKQLNDKIINLSNAKLFIDDTPALSIFEFRAKCRRLVDQHGIKMAIIDYLQLMTGPSGNGNREQEVSMISRSLKAVAKELNIPIIALSQLSRAVETRGGNKRPVLSDLRESGAIEQDADIVLFIHRPEYYGIAATEDGTSTANLAEIIVAKHRNGALDTVPLTFRKELARFSDMYSFSSDAATFSASSITSDDGSVTHVTTTTYTSKINSDFDLGDQDAGSFKLDNPTDNIPY